MSAACERVSAELREIPAALMAAQEAAAQFQYSVKAKDVCADPYLLVAKAGTGDIAAQRNAADMVLLYVLYANDPSPLATLREGLLFARQAASRGEAPDLFRLVFMLSVAGTICPLNEAEEFAGEMLAIVEILADQGDEQCATLLSGVAENETAETMRIAKGIKARICEAWEI